MAGPAKRETLMVRIDTKSKRLVTRAAERRRISASDYVRDVFINRLFIEWARLDAMMR